MRNSTDKEIIVKELLSGNYSWKEKTEKYNLSKSVLSKWKNQYSIDDIKVFDSKRSKRINHGLYLRNPNIKLKN